MKCKSVSVLYYTLTIIIGVVAISLYLRKDGSKTSTVPSTQLSDDYLLKLHKYGVHPETRLHVNELDGRVSRDFPPDTTAIILNWSRFENVKLIASLLCGPWLNDIIFQVVIWNNNPEIRLNFKDFLGTGCSEQKLYVHNSDINLYFQARFLACARAKSPYCFIQDDDYLIEPIVISNMHRVFHQSPLSPSLHLLPAHEYFLSRLRKFTSSDQRINTAFAWLGHGCYARREMVVSFLDLLQKLQLSTGEMEMADNYFTILANRPKDREIWFDHGIELGGGQPFTVGLAGEDRNNRHIARALEYLAVYKTNNTLRSPYVNSGISEVEEVDQIVEAPCRLALCLIETNIRILPEDISGKADLQKYPVSSRKIDQNEQFLRDWYIKFPPSAMVDSRLETEFRSHDVSKVGDWIILDVLEDITGSDSILLTLVTNAETAEMLGTVCELSLSTNKKSWQSIPHRLHCFDRKDVIEFPLLKECSIYILNNLPMRYIRITKTSHPKDMITSKKDTYWVVHEVSVIFV